MRKKRILCFLLIVLFVLPIVACGGEETDTGQNGTGTVNDQGTGLQENRGEEGTLNGQGTASPEGIGISGEKESGTPSEGELINIIYNAESALLNLCVEGFDAEFQGTGKKGFDQASRDLLKYYTKDYLYPTWKDFYENHLGEWGYGMGELFMFADYDTAKDSFAGMSKKQDKIEVYFNYDMSGDEYHDFDGEIAEYTYILVQSNGGWFIDDVLFKQ